eukprot:scaffold23020_cov118-Isochrysis_galbana.AAC.3
MFIFVRGVKPSALLIVGGARTGVGFPPSLPAPFPETGSALRRRSRHASRVGRALSVCAAGRQPERP